jgi:hypothetical protein
VFPEKINVDHKKATLNLMKKLSLFYTRYFQEVAYHKPELLKDPKTGEKVFSRQILISFFPKRTVRFGEGSL